MVGELADMLAEQALAVGLAGEDLVVVVILVAGADERVKPPSPKSRSLTLDLVPNTTRSLGRVLWSTIRRGRACP